MHRQQGRALIAVIAIATIQFAMPLVGQVPESNTGGQPPVASSDTTSALTVPDVEATLAAIEKDSGLDEAVKDQLRSKYTQAIEALKEAEKNSTKAAKYRETMANAADDITKLRAELMSLPSVENASNVRLSANDANLKKEADSLRATLTDLTDQLSKTSSELSRVIGRPVEISSRLPNIQREMSLIDEELESPELAEATSPGLVADRVLLQANQAQLSSELEMLKQEQLSQSSREERLQAQQELLTRQVENSSAELNTLDALLHQRLASEAKKLSTLAETLRQELPAADQAAQTMAIEVQALAKEYEGVIDKLKTVKDVQAGVVTQSRDLSNEYESIREQLKLAGGGMAMVQVLFDLQGRVLRADNDMQSAQLSTLGETRLASFKVTEELRRQSELEKQLTSTSSDTMTKCITMRRKVLDELQTQYANLFQSLAALEGDKQQYLNTAEEVHDYVSQQLFGFDMKSCPVISAETLTDVPGGLRWLFKEDHWRQLGASLWDIITRMPVRSMGMAAILAILLLMRRRMGVALEQTGVQIRRISTDRFSHTGKALAITVLLAVPIPLLFWYTGWALGQTAASSDWMQGVTKGLPFAAVVALFATCTVTVCRPNGLGGAHFKWKHESLAAYRKAVFWFTVVYIPVMFVTVSCHYGDASQYFPSLGRISFLLAHAWMAIILWRLFYAAGGIRDSLTSEHPISLFTRLRILLYYLLILCPIALFVLACIGYLITATQWSLGLISTAALFVAGNVLHAMALRWFRMNERKLALAQALEKRREQRETADTEALQEATEEILSVDPEDEEMDLDSISEQTSRLLRIALCLRGGYSNHRLLVVNFSTD